MEQLVVNGQRYNVASGSCIDCQMEHGKDGHCLGRDICSVTGSNIFIKAGVKRR